MGDGQAIADALVSSGLRDAGYNQVHVDCGWSLPQRASDGSLQPDPQRFPSGMAALADYVHARGLGFGMYTEHWTTDCCGGPGMAGHYQQDANTFARWVVMRWLVISFGGGAP